MLHRRHVIWSEKKRKKQKTKEEVGLVYLTTHARNSRDSRRDWVDVGVASTCSSPWSGLPVLQMVTQSYQFLRRYKSGSMTSRPPKSQVHATALSLFSMLSSTTSSPWHPLHKKLTRLCSRLTSNFWCLPSIGWSLLPAASPWRLRLKLVGVE